MRRPSFPFHLLPLLPLLLLLLEHAGAAVPQSNESGEVELDALCDMIVRLGVAAADDDELRAWIAEADRDGNNTLSFFEYVRVEAELLQRPTVVSWYDAGKRIAS